MKNHGYFKTPEHGLQLEETITANDAEGVRHLFRYWWAFDVGRLMNTARVHDLGCGGGYGSRILLEIPEVKRVVGVDLQPAALNMARGDYADPRLAWAEFHLENHWEDHKETAEPADLIAAFEVFEMLKHREFFLEQAAAKLANDGVLLLSANFVGRQKCHSAPTDAYFHYNRPVLERLLKRYFGVVKFAQDSKPEDGDVLFKLKHHYDAVVRKAAVNTTKKFEPYPVGDNAIFCAQPLR